MKRIHIIILASGRGKRFGSNKLLALLHGEPIIYYTLEKIKKLKTQNPYWLGEICLVTDHKEVEVLAKAYQFKVLFNPDAEEGISGSIRQGTSYNINRFKEDGLLFWVGDQPLLSIESIDRLAETFLRDSSKITVLSSGDILGNPVIFPLSFKSELLELKGEKGGKSIIKRFPESYQKVEASFKEELLDIDFKSDMQYFEQVKNRGLIKKD